MTFNRFQRRFSLFISGASLIAGLVLLPISSNAAHAAGYVLACLVPCVLVTAQRQAAMRVRQHEGTVESNTARVAARMILLLGCTAGVLHAWQFAWSVS